VDAPKRQQLVQRTKSFGVDVARLVMAMPGGSKSDPISRQLLRSATSVGANYRSACRARSKADFVSKIGIAEEEADEAEYWLEVLFELGLIEEVVFKRLHREAGELTAIFVASGRTAKQST